MNNRLTYEIAYHITSKFGLTEHESFLLDKSNSLLNKKFLSDKRISFQEENDEKSYKQALEMLKSDDDFDKLKAVKFFVAYGQNAPVDEIFDAMKSSRMPENISGEIPFLISLNSILHSDKQKNVLIAIDNILSGLGEILPLSQVFQFELFDILNELININKEENHYKSKISQILLKALLKFEMICKNDEYIF